MLSPTEFGQIFDSAVEDIVCLSSCPRCDHSKALRKLASRPTVLRCSKCRYETNPKRESVFFRTRLPGATWARAAMLLKSDENITSVAIAKDLQVTQKTAWRILKVLETNEGAQFVDIVNAQIRARNSDSPQQTGQISVATPEVHQDSPAKHAALGDLYHDDCIEGMSRRVPDSSVDLIVADPPYFKVIGEKWDYQWRTEGEYLEWSRQWLEEAYRSLRLGGSFYLFGYFRILAKLVPVLEDIGFKLRQQIIVDKGMQAVSGRATKNYKQFPNVTESVLFLIKDPIPFSRAFLKQRQQDLGLTAKFINESLGVKSNGGGMWSIYTGKNICEQLPTREQWESLSRVLEFDLPYEDISITFNAEMGLTDVWTDIQFYQKGVKRIHPTQKPLTLIERLIRASSNVGDVILDPFMGSGTTAVAATALGRNWIGFENDEKYYQAAENRIRETVSSNLSATSDNLHTIAAESVLF